MNATLVQLAQITRVFESNNYGRITAHSLDTCGITRRGKNPNETTIFNWFGVPSARHAVLWGVVHSTWLLALSEALEAEVSLFSPIPPTVANDPVHDTILLAIPHELNSMVNIETFVERPWFHNTSTIDLKSQASGRNANGNGALCRDGVHQGCIVVGGQQRETSVFAYRFNLRCVTLTCAAGEWVILFCCETCGFCVVESQGLRGTLATAGATAMIRIRCATDDLLSADFRSWFACGNS